MRIQSSMKNSKICQILKFCERQRSMFGSIKNELHIVKTFWDHFWKVQGLLFPILNFFEEFGTFCNLNGIPQFSQKNATFLPSYRFGYKKASKFIILLMQIWYSESMDHKLSKTGLRMFLRPLVMFLWSFEVLAILLKI